MSKKFSDNSRTIFVESPILGTDSCPAYIFKPIVYPSFMHSLKTFIPYLCFLFWMYWRNDNGPTKGTTDSSTYIFSPGILHFLNLCTNISAKPRILNIRSLRGHSSLLEQRKLLSHNLNRFLVIKLEMPDL